MDNAERNRLRERLNFPGPTPDDPVFVPGDPDPTPPPTEEPGVAAGDAGDAIVAALDRLAAVAERLDTELRATRGDIERLHQRLDQLEREAPLEIDELAGLEAVRRTVAASHRALAAQLSRMFDSLERRRERGDEDEFLVGAGRAD